MTWEIRQGDALTLLREMPAESVRCCITSPPYWGLRDYGTATWEGGAADCAHKGRPKPRQDTHGQRDENHGRFAATRGTQPAKAHYAIPVREVCSCGARRIDAQLGLEPTPEKYVSRMVELFGEVRRVLTPDGTLWLNLGDSYAANGISGLAIKGESSTLVGSANVAHAAQRKEVPVGLKPKDLVGIPWRVAFALQADGWWLRSDIVWAKPNPMPESVTDRPTKAHEYLFLLAKSERYYYDAAAIAEKANPENYRANATLRAVAPGQTAQGKLDARRGEVSCDTRNRRTVWSITSQPFAEAHFATFPEALVEPCILAGSAPGDLVIDPFAGSGTVGVVALRYGRRFLDLELNPAYCEMARRRIAGPLFAEQGA